MADARIAIAITLDVAHEGGFQNDHDDRANWTGGQVGVGTLVGTKYGITYADMPGADIKNLTEEQATEYYLEHYWKTLYSQIESQDVASKLFDLGVLFGVGTAVGMLQTTLNIAVDHVFGPDTLDHVNATDPISLLSGYKFYFVKHALQIGADNPNERPFVSDWIRRINS